MGHHPLSCVPHALPPNQKYNSLGALCDSVLIAPSLLHRESGAVSRPIPSQLMMPYWFSGPLSLLYQHIPFSPRFFIMSYSTIPKRICQVKNYMINATDMSITNTPIPIPMTIPNRKAFPSGSIVGRNFIQLYPYPSLHTFYTTLSRDCQHLFTLFL